ncbi:MAG TPA: glycosyltransferase family 4 protein [Beutenbergiaceae bacterium]|nr:glycosyltransferase family 4 protein [Beutenbergiaceae bacterium]
MTAHIDDPLASLAEHCAGRRIAYVCADPGIGIFGTKGASVHVQAVVRAMRRAGAVVEIFAAKTGGRAPADLVDVPVHGLPSQPKTDDEGHRLTAAGREAALLAADAQAGEVIAAAGHFDLLYQRYSLFSAAPAETARAAGTQVMLEVNAPLIDEHATHRTLAHYDEAHSVLQRVIAAADLAVCVSEPVRTWLTALHPDARAVVVPNGADVHRITPRDQPRLAGETVTLGFVGTLKPWHGVEALVEAAAPLLAGECRVPVHLMIVGDGPLAEQVDERARREGITDHITRTGAVNPAQIPGLLHQMDIGLAPYPAEAETYFSPLKVLEYLAAGLPVVASAVGQLPTLIQHEQTGLLVPPSDPTALRQALVRLIASPEVRARYGHAGRERAVRRHSWEHAVAQTMAALPPQTKGGLSTEVAA